MKKVEALLFERGDHVMITVGYNKGRVGTVLSHSGVGQDVVFKLVDKDYDEDSDWDDDDGMYDEAEDKALKYLTPAEYEAILKAQKIMMIPGLPVHLQFKGANLIVGDNVITKANAIKLAKFITDNTKTKKAKKRA